MLNQPIAKETCDTFPVADRVGKGSLGIPRSCEKGRNNDGRLYWPHKYHVPCSPNSVCEFFTVLSVCSL